MTVLYSLHLARHVKGFGKPCVKAIEANYAGHFDDEAKRIVMPDRQEVRQCLPPYWRRAFDRSSIWFEKNIPFDKPGYATLYDRKGRYLNTIYFFPYRLT